jgi:sulfite exporter TauE/SafE
MTYAGIGAVLGVVGASGALSPLSGPFSPLALSRYLKFGVGLTLVALGIGILVSWVRRRTASTPEGVSFVPQGTVDRLASRMRGRRGLWGLPFGMLMGLLPCGPLLPAELAALSSSSALLGDGVMLAFGFGTVPALAGFGTLGSVVGSRVRGWLVPAAGTVVVALGAITLAQAAMMLAR